MTGAALGSEDTAANARQQSVWMAYREKKDLCGRGFPVEMGQGVTEDVDGRLRMPEKQWITWEEARTRGRR